MPLSKKRMSEAKAESRKKPMSNLNQEDVKPKSEIKLHPIMEALANPEKRERLRKVCASLKEFNQLENVMYGLRRPILMSKVAELLEAF